MTEIYLIRHAQAKGNRYRILQGQWDGGVSALGLREIELLAERFRAVPVDAVWSSDLSRACLTAGAVTRWGPLPLHTDERLREIQIGPWERKFFGNVLHEEPEQAQNFLRDQERFSLPGAETYIEVGERAEAALRDIVAACPGQTVAVVSHGITLRSLMSRLLGIPLNDTQALPVCVNTGVTHLYWDGRRFRLDYYNDTRHLAALDKPAWSRSGNLRDEPLDPAEDPGFYQACYADAWRTAHGSLEGYSPAVYLHAAREHFRAEPAAVRRLLLEDRCVGLLDMDTARGAHAAYGWISLLYLKPEFRGQGYGIQALARALLLYEARGRRSLRLNVAESNRSALAFYEREGFRVLSRFGGSDGLLLMERPLGGQRHG